MNHKKKYFNIWINVVIIFIISIIIGSIFYAYIFNIDYLYAFYNTALIFTTINAELKSKTSLQQIFIIFLSIIIVFLFLLTVNLTTKILLKL